MAEYNVEQQLLTPISPLLPSCPQTCDNIPPLPIASPDDMDLSSPETATRAMATGLQLLAAERDGLTHILDVYSRSKVAQENFMISVDIIAKTVRGHSKLIVCGVGKSGKIGEKLVATFNSLEVRSVSLHYGDALHGDLGMIGENDAILLISYSGRTSELRTLLGYIRPHHPVFLLTAHPTDVPCALFSSRPASCSFILPASIPIPEKDIFGLAAPTISTTVALAVGDALAMATARRLHSSVADVFRMHHPGGAIGVANSVATSHSKQKTMSDISIMVDDVPLLSKSRLPSASGAHTAVDLVMTAARSPSGWVRPTTMSIISPRRIQSLDQCLDQPISSLCELGLIVEKGDWISVEASWTVEGARNWICTMLATERGRSFLKEGTILGIVDAQKNVSGVVEIEDIIDL